MASLRRTMLLATGTVVGGVTAGAWAILGDDSDGNDSDEKGAGSDPASDGKSEGDDAGGDGDTTAGDDTGDESDTREQEQEHPEAADPPTDPNNTPDESEYASPDEAQASQPTEADVTISNTEVVDASSGTAVTGELTNESDTTIGTIDVEATLYLADGSTTTALWGTNDLAAGETWDFEIMADHVEYNSVTEYDLRPLL